MNTKQKIEVMQAYLDGKTVQVKCESTWEDWQCDIGEPNWSWSVSEYRIKPEPREWWINVFGSGAMYPYPSQDAADNASDESRLERIHVREVLEDGQ